MPDAGLFGEEAVVGESQLGTVYGTDGSNAPVSSSNLLGPYQPGAVEDQRGRGSLFLNDAPQRSEGIDA